MAVVRMVEDDRYRIDVLHQTPAGQGTLGSTRRRGRVWSAVAAVWGAITGLAPHVLHHVGPLAGAALLAGAAGTALFGALGTVAAIPFLLRLRRRFGTWAAPAIALAVFAGMFAVSTVVVGPSLTTDAAVPETVSEAEHAEHHP